MPAGSCVTSTLGTAAHDPGLTAGLLSKVSQAVQHLDLNDNNPAQQEASDQLSTSPNSVLQPGSASSPTQASDTPAQQGSVQSQTSQQPGMPDSSKDWQKASSSHNAARKKKRKQQRRAASHTEPVPSAPSVNGSADAVLPPSTTSTQADQLVYASRSGDVVISNAEDQTAANSLPRSTAPSVTAVTSNPAATSQHDESAASAPSHESADSELGSAQSADDGDSDTSASLCDESQLADSAARDSEADEQSSNEEESTDGAAFQSSVASVTADFAMQNVILQMGLRLVAPNGMRIKQLSRWVLRCSACFKITKEPGRLFCPHCGNSTLDKVEAVIGPDGTEQYGIRKRFNTRGTRYSLPKPKGGSQRNAPILREDVLMQKLNKRRNRKPKEEAVDAFAPEYGPDSWFQKNHGSAAQYKGAAAALASWKHSPNERKHTRTNRRKK